MSRLDLVGIRTTLTSALEANGLAVFDHLPAQLHPPVVLIEPDDPYVTDEDPDIPYGHVKVAWTAHVIARGGTPATRTLNLDALIVETVYAMPEDWTIGNIAIPYSLSLGDRSWLASRINVSTIARL